MLRISNFTEADICSRVRQVKGKTVCKACMGQIGVTPRADNSGREEQARKLGREARGGLESEVSVGVNKWKLVPPGPASREL